MKNGRWSCKCEHTGVGYPTQRVKAILPRGQKSRPVPKPHVVVLNQNLTAALTNPTNQNQSNGPAPNISPMQRTHRRKQAVVLTTTLDDEESSRGTETVCRTTLLPNPENINESNMTDSHSSPEAQQIDSMGRLQQGSTEPPQSSHQPTTIIFQTDMSSQTTLNPTATRSPTTTNTNTTSTLPNQSLFEGATTFPTTNDANGRPLTGSQLFPPPPPPPPPPHSRSQLDISKSSKHPCISFTNSITSISPTRKGSACCTH